MPVNKPHTSKKGIYFIIFTNYEWMPLFKIINGYDLVYKWFDVLKDKGHSVLGYLIMPNHIHALIGLTDTQVSINTTMGNGKTNNIWPFCKLGIRRETQV